MMPENIRDWILYIAFCIYAVYAIFSISYASENQIEKPVVETRLVVEFSPAVLTTSWDKAPTTKDYKPGRYYTANKNMILYLQGSGLVVDVSGEKKVNITKGIVAITKGEEFSIKGTAGDFRRIPLAVLNDKKYLDITKGTKK